jgi:Na+-translocating ferredoxin:NAD+ oxidoreductase RnfG subunit
MYLQIKKLYPIFLIIFVVFLSVSLLVTFDSATLEVLESRQEQETLELLQQIFPEAYLYTYNTDTEIYTIYNAGRREIGHAFYGSDWGYRGKIVVLVGLKDTETIMDIVVTKQIEDYIYWLRLEENNFFEQFVGLKIEECYPSRSWLPGGVDVITGSSMSSWGVIGAVRYSTLEKIKYLE